MFTNEYTESVKSMRRRTVRLDREGDYWTVEEKQQLIDMFEMGEGITAMALQLQRTEPAIVQMIEKLDLFKRKECPVRKKSVPKSPDCLCSICQLEPALCPYCEACHKLVEAD